MAESTRVPRDGRGPQNIARTSLFWALIAFLIPGGPGTVGSSAWADEPAPPRAPVARPEDLQPARTSEELAQPSAPKDSSRARAPVVARADRADRADPAEEPARRAYRTTLVGRSDRPRPREDLAASASVITGERTPRSGETAADVLAELPGVAVTRLGGPGAAAFVALRGSSWDQVGLYVDGVPLNLAPGLDVDLSSIDLANVERIEVYRGTTPIAFPRAAMGGVVSVTTRVPRATHAHVALGAGSFGTRSFAARAAVAAGAMRVLATARLLSSDGDFAYRDTGAPNDPDDDTTRLRGNNAVDQREATVHAVADLAGRRSASLSGSLFTDARGLPGAGRVQATQAHVDTTRGLVSARYLGPDDLGLGAPLTLAAHALVTTVALADPLAEVGFTTSDTHDVTLAAGVGARGEKDLGDALRLEGFVDGRVERFRPEDRARATSASGVPAQRLVLATGVEARLAVPRLRLDVLPALRLELSRDTRTGRDGFGAPLPAGLPIARALPLVRLGVRHRASDTVVLRANLAHAARLPNLLELYGNAGFFVGQPDLVPESSWNADLGVTATFTRGPAAVELETTLFASRVADLIQPLYDAYGRAIPRNIGRARILGAELLVAGHAGRHLLARGQLTLTDARDRSPGVSQYDRQLPLRPRVRGHARLEGRALPVGGGVEAGAYLEADAAAGISVDPANLSTFPARALLGAGASLSFAQKRLALVASVTNLTGVRGPGAYDLNGFPLPGRAVFIALSATVGQPDKEIHP